MEFLLCRFSNGMIRKPMRKKAFEPIDEEEKRMNIRISERDIRNLKIKAMEEGLSYQTLVSMIIHKYLHPEEGRSCIAVRERLRQVRQRLPENILREFTQEYPKRT